MSTNASVITVGTPVANQSVSGTVNVGNLPINQNVSGSVVATQGTSPWVTSQSGSIAAVIVGGSIAASFTPPANQSVSGTVQTDVRGSVATVIIGGSIAATFTPPANQSVSGTVNVASLISMPGIVSAANSTTTPVTSTLSFTGTGEEWKDFGSIVINVFTDAVSGTDGLSIQQSSDNSNWDIRDTYSIPSMAAGQGKTIQVQPAARFGRVVYTQGAQNSGAFRLQTIYHPQMVKPTSQRPQDAYTNETDLEQTQSFGMVYNGSTWDRMRGTTAGIAVAGSVVAFQGGTQITSLVSTVPSSVQVGVSIMGTAPVNIAQILGGTAGIAAAGPVGVNTLRVTVATDQASLVTTVNALQGHSISGTVNVGNFPTTQNVSGSVVAFVSGLQGSSISGTVLVNNGSVVAFQGTNPWFIGSIVGTYAEDSAHTSADKGLFTMGVRNDTVASFVSADLEYAPHASDSAGRTLIKPFAAEEARVEGYNSVVSASVTTLLSAAGAGLRNYITDVWIANTGAATTLVTFRSGGGASVLGYTIAPAGGGSNLPGLAVPIRTEANATFDFQATTSTSVLFATVRGFKAP